MAWLRDPFFRPELHDQHPLAGLLTICLLLLAGCTAVEASPMSPRRLDHRLTYYKMCILARHSGIDPSRCGPDPMAHLW
jgi:hypothetical protein